LRVCDVRIRTGDTRSSPRVTLLRMAFDTALGERVRGQLAGASGLVEKKMFGGLAFLLDGNLAVGVRGDDLMVRGGRDGVEDALGRPPARESWMGDRLMKGWILVAPDGVAADEDLAAWVARGTAFARSLPAKP